MKKNNKTWNVVIVFILLFLFSITVMIVSIKLKSIVSIFVAGGCALFFMVLIGICLNDRRKKVLENDQYGLTKLHPQD